MISEREFNLLKELVARDSMDSLKRTIKEWELTDFQAFCVAFCYIREKAIISLDTGMGKTLVSASLMNLDTSRKKWLFVSKNTNLTQNANKLRRLLFNKTVTCTTAQQDEMKLFAVTGLQNDVYVITYETFSSYEFCDLLFKIRNNFIGIIVDESHNIGNIGSNRSEMIKAMLKSCFKYQFFLTATPLTTNPLQILNQISMIDSSLVPDPQELAMKYTIYKNGSVIGYHHLDELNKIISDYGLRYINVTRESQNMRGNYTPKLYICEHDRQEVINTPDKLKTLKSNSSCLSVSAVKNVVKRNMKSGKKGLIYANMNVYKSMLMEELSKICKVCLLDGSVKKGDKDIIVADFNNDKYDVLVSNLTEGRDMPCDYIIFYEMTSLFKQFIGRGERGLSGRDLEIDFILMADSYEIKFFYNHIYKVSILLNKLCGKDTMEIAAIEKQLSNYLSEEDLMDFEDLKNVNKDLYW